MQGDALMPCMLQRLGDSGRLQLSLGLDAERSSGLSKSSPTRIPVNVADPCSGLHMMTCQVGCEELPWQMVSMHAVLLQWPKRNELVLLASCHV
eukprot:2606665-Amphidinium_carterae.4